MTEKPTRSLQAYLGHKNIQHTVKYTELAPTRFKVGAIDRLARCQCEGHRAARPYVYRTATNVGVSSADGSIVFGSGG